MWVGSDYKWLWTTDSGEILKRNIIRLDLNEAEVLQEVCISSAEGIVEIGRLFGGSTFLITDSSKNPDVRVISIDSQDNLTSHKVLNKRSSKYFNRTIDTNYNGTYKIFNALVDFMNKGKLKLINEFSQDVKLDMKYDVLFIDGDHTYEGVKSDVINFWGNSTKYILFHDYKDDPRFKYGVHSIVGDLLSSKCCRVYKHQGSMMALEKLTELPNNLVYKWEWSI